MNEENHNRVFVSNDPVNWIDPWGLQRDIIGVSQYFHNGGTAGPWHKEAAAAISKAKPSEQFLNNLSTHSGIAGAATLFVPGGQTATLAFAGISAASTGLKISLYSDEPVKDTACETIKMAVPYKEYEPVKFLVEPVINKTFDIGKKILNGQSK